MRERLSLGFTAIGLMTTPIRTRPVIRIASIGGGRLPILARMNMGRNPLDRHRLLRLDSRCSDINGQSRCTPAGQGIRGPCPDSKVRLAAIVNHAKRGALMHYGA